MKPRTRKTAISVTRSRAAIAIVFAAIRRMTTAMIVVIDPTRSFTFPSIETHMLWNSFSVSDRVGYEEFSNIASICFGTRSVSATEAVFSQYQPT